VLFCGAPARADDDGTTCFDAQKTRDFAAMAVYCRSTADSKAAFLAENPTAPPELVAASEGMAALTYLYAGQGEQGLHNHPAALGDWMKSWRAAQIVLSLEGTTSQFGPIPKDRFVHEDVLPFLLVHLPPDLRTSP
jgi:hypothetical protein